MDRLTVFDTTLRDGEQRPATRSPSTRSSAWRGSSTSWVSTSSQAGFRSRPTPTPRPFAAWGAVRRPVIAGLARCCRADIERAGESLKPRPRSRIHTFIARVGPALERKLRITREPASRPRSTPSGARARTRTTCSSRPRTRRGATWSSWCRVIDAVIQGRRHDDQPARHGRLSTRRRFGAFFTEIPGAGAGAGRGRLQHALPRRPRLAVANSLARSGGRAPGGSARSTASRACRQRLAGGDGDGARACGAIVTPTRRGSAPRRCTPRASCYHPDGEPVQAKQGDRGPERLRHEAGIHQDGMLKDRRTYEIMRPEKSASCRRRSCLANTRGATRGAPRRAARLHALALRVDSRLPRDDCAGRPAEDRVGRRAGPLSWTGSRQGNRPEKSQRPGSGSHVARRSRPCAPCCSRCPSWLRGRSATFSGAFSE